MLFLFFCACRRSSGVEKTNENSFFFFLCIVSCRTAVVRQKNTMPRGPKFGHENCAEK